MNLRFSLCGWEMAARLSTHRSLGRCGLNTTSLPVRGSGEDGLKVRSPTGRLQVYPELANSIGVVSDGAYK